MTLLGSKKVIKNILCNVATLIMYLILISICFIKIDYSVKNLLYSLIVLVLWSMLLGFLVIDLKWFSCISVLVLGCVIWCICFITNPQYSKSCEVTDSGTVWLLYSIYTIWIEPYRIGIDDKLYMSNHIYGSFFSLIYTIIPQLVIWIGVFVGKCIKNLLKRRNNQISKL